MNPIRCALMRTAICVGVAATTLSGASVASAQPREQLAVTDLGTPAGYSFSAAGAVSQRGRVVGFATSLSSAGPVTHAAIWDSGHAALLAGDSSAATGINRRGISVGYANVAGSLHAVEWRTDGASRDLGTLAGGAWSQATAINDRGQVIGYGDTATGTHAFVESNSGLRDLGTLGTGFSYAYAINERGQIAGSANGQAVLWASNGSMAVLPDSGQRSLAYGLNDSGLVVGSVDGHPFMWQAGVGHSLSRPNQELFGYAAAVNASNWIIGSVQVIDSSGMPQFHAVAWQGGVMCDLNNLLAPNSGWQLNDATSINAAGVIVGTGTRNGQQRAFSLSLSRSVERGC